MKTDLKASGPINPKTLNFPCTFAAAAAVRPPGGFHRPWLSGTDNSSAQQPFEEPRSKRPRTDSSGEEDIDVTSFSPEPNHQPATESQSQLDEPRFMSTPRRQNVSGEADCSEGVDLPGLSSQPNSQPATKSQLEEPKYMSTPQIEKERQSINSGDIIDLASLNSQPNSQPSTTNQLQEPKSMSTSRRQRLKRKDSDEVIGLTDRNPQPSTSYSNQPRHTSTPKRCRMISPQNNQRFPSSGFPGPVPQFSVHPDLMLPQLQMPSPIPPPPGNPYQQFQMMSGPSQYSSQYPSQYLNQYPSQYPSHRSQYLQPGPSFLHPGPGHFPPSPIMNPPMHLSMGLSAESGYFGGSFTSPGSLSGPMQGFHVPMNHSAAMAVSTPPTGQGSKKGKGKGKGSSTQSQASAAEASEEPSRPSDDKPERLSRAPEVNQDGASNNSEQNGDGGTTSSNSKRNGRSASNDDSERNGDRTNDNSDTDSADDDDDSKPPAFTPEAQRICLEWYNAHITYPYLTKTQAEELANRCHITPKQVRKFMANRRKRGDRTLSRTGAIHPLRLQRMLREAEHEGREAVLGAELEARERMRFIMQEQEKAMAAANLRQLQIAQKFHDFVNRK